MPPRPEPRSCAHPRTRGSATPASIVVVGSSNTDLILRVTHLPRPGETVLGGKFSTAAGGKGANQAVAAARAGGKVMLIARVGKDMYGDAAVAGLQRDGVDVKHVTRDAAAASGMALIFVARSGENSIGVAGGANGKLSPTAVTGAAKAIRQAGILVMQLETPLATVKAAAAIAVRAGVPVLLNPAPARPLPGALLKRVSILTPNETEAESLTGVAVTDVASAAKAAARLRARGVRTVIVTLGARGAYLADAGGGQLVPGFKVKAVDTTAAGDVFNGALAVAVTEGRSVLDAVRFANAAAALSVTRHGAQPSAPARRAIEKLLSGFAAAAVRS